MKTIKYLKYIFKHKLYTFLAGLELGVPVIQLFCHDLSKFLPGEWFPYLEHFYGRGKNRKEFNLAWLQHIHRNKHHWQYWVLRNDDGTVECLEMPDKYLLEMCADWIGVARALGKADRYAALDWYYENKDKIQLHPKTQYKVIVVLATYGGYIAN